MAFRNERSLCRTIKRRGKLNESRVDTDNLRKHSRNIMAIGGEKQMMKWFKLLIKVVTTVAIGLIEIYA